MIDYNRYQQSFRATTSPSFIESEINERLLEKLDFIHIEPESILDLGCGAGFGLSLLQQRFPKSNIKGMDINAKTLAHVAKNLPFKKQELTCTDFNAPLPYPAHSFDLIIANFSLQGAKNIYDLLKALFEILKPNGILLFSMLAEESLKEFRASWEHIDQYCHHNPFISAKDMSNILQHSLFNDTVLDCEEITLEYSSVHNAIKDIQHFNEPLSLKNMRTTLTGKQRWQAFEHQWRVLFQQKDGKIPSSYHIMYGHACKQKKAQLKLEQSNEAKFSLAEISAYLKQGTKPT